MVSRLTISEIARHSSKMSLQEVEGIVSAIDKLSVYTLGDVVELGCYRGGTTEIIAANISASRTLWAIDIFDCIEKKPEMDLCQGQTIEPHILYHDRLKRYENTFIIIGESSAIGSRWHSSIAALIIDAGHHFEEVKSDFNAWSSNVVEGGILIIHDAAKCSNIRGLENNILTGIAGVIKFNEEMLREADWEYSHTIDTAVFYKKKKRFSYPKM